MEKRDFFKVWRNTSDFGEGYALGVERCNLLEQLKNHPALQVGALRLVAAPDLSTKAIDHLQAMRRAPKMYFRCREALLASVTHLVAFVDDDFNTLDFYVTHAGTHGNCYNDMSVPVDDEWAHKTIDAAIAWLSIDKPET